MKRWIALVLVMLLAFMAGAEELDFLGFEEKEAMTDEEYLELVYAEVEPSDFLQNTLPEGKKTVTILTHYSLGVHKEYFKKLFGGEIVEVICGVTEYSSKLQSMIAAGNPPDLVVGESSTNPSVATYVNAGLVQPVDGLIDYNEPELKKLQKTYETGLWKDAHYLMPYTQKPLYMLIYNPVIFEDNGLETPWELWEQGEWTWNAFRDYAQFLNIQKEDGSWQTFGTCIPSYGVLSASTGVDYVTMGNGTYSINVLDPRIVRAENFMNDMIYKDDIIKVKAQSAWKGYWTRGMLAMQIVESHLFDADADIAKAAKNGRLGVCPLPQDPEYNVPGEYHTYGQSGGFYLVNGARNPEGAVMFVRMLAYVTQYEVPQLEISYQSKLDKYHERGFTNEVLYQKHVAWDISDSIVSYGYGVISDKGIWEFMGGQDNWTSYVETILPGIEEAIAEMME